MTNDHALRAAEAVLADLRGRNLATLPNSPHAATELASLIRTAIDAAVAEERENTQVAINLLAICHEERDSERQLYAALVEAAKAAIPYLENGIPPATGWDHVCGPESQCDGRCMDWANFTEMMHALDAALAKLPKERK